MNRKELIKNAAAILRYNRVKKPVTHPRRVFHISDERGHSTTFTWKQTRGHTMYTTDDVEVILDAVMEAIEDSVRRGDSIDLYGFASIRVEKQAERDFTMPFTGKVVTVPSRYVLRLTKGAKLQRAIDMYNENGDVEAPTWTEIVADMDFSDEDYEDEDVINAE